MDKQYIVIPRTTLEGLLKEARMIAACDKSAHLSEAGSAYAHALAAAMAERRGSSVS